MTRKSASIGDMAAGKIKRAAGELSGRPDLVLEGEAQDTGGPSEAGRIGNAKEKKAKTLPPRHQSVGMGNDASEHEDERLHPGGTKKSASGAPRDKPAGPSGSS